MSIYYNSTVNARAARTQERIAEKYGVLKPEEKQRREKVTVREQSANALSEMARANAAEMAHKAYLKAIASQAPEDLHRYAAKLGHPLSLEALAKLSPPSKSGALLRRASIAWLSGNIFTPSIDKAFRAMKEAADKGDFIANYVLGWAYNEEKEQSGFPISQFQKKPFYVNKNNNLAIKHFKEASIKLEERKQDLQRGDFPLNGKKWQIVLEMEKRIADLSSRFSHLFPQPSVADDEP